MRSFTMLLLLALGGIACGKVDDGSPTDGAPPGDEPVEPGAGALMDRLAEDRLSGGRGAQGIY